MQSESDAMSYVPAAAERSTRSAAGGDVLRSINQTGCCDRDIPCSREIIANKLLQRFRRVNKFLGKARQNTHYLLSLAGYRLYLI
jgi:hypothetical protein